MDAFAISLSLNLQYGVSLETLIRKFTHTRFEPAGMTANKEIPMVKSIIDYIFRWMALRFLEADKAKLYHNPELVDKSYESGTNARVLIPYINGKGHSEIRMTEAQIVFENTDIGIPVTVAAPKPKTMVKASTQQVAEKKVAVIQAAAVKVEESASATSSLEQLLKQQQDLAAKTSDSDAPMCTNYGSTTQRQGSCYYCPSCGETTGCS